ncbi:unnamed protein product [Pleuronectes platessa]|uniref:Uncharacterized protein n=1 Tax=Pleuronectes platessa TaxID=8262 RepID=A0A9N7YS04_PLEPL|nr:unnamed protein product [Pleuronectes platessa]
MLQGVFQVSPVIEKVTLSHHCTTEYGLFHVVTRPLAVVPSFHQSCPSDRKSLIDSTRTRSAGTQRSGVIRPEDFFFEGLLLSRRRRFSVFSIGNNYIYICLPLSEPAS